MGSQILESWWKGIPLCLVLCKDLSLRMVSNDLNIDEATKVQFLRPEHRHVGSFRWNRALIEEVQRMLVVIVDRILKFRN